MLLVLLLCAVVALLLVLVLLVRSGGSRKSGRAPASDDDKFWSAFAALPGPPMPKGASDHSSLLVQKGGLVLPFCSRGLLTNIIGDNVTSDCRWSPSVLAGMTEFVCQNHAKYGPVFAFRMGPLPEQVSAAIFFPFLSLMTMMPQARWLITRTSTQAMVSVSDPTLLQSSLRMGSRPKALFRLGQTSNLFTA